MYVTGCEREPQQGRNHSEVGGESRVVGLGNFGNFALVVNGNEEIDLAGRCA